MRPIHVIGGGLAGSEAAWQAAEAGATVVLHEMRPLRGTPVHHTARLAELVCSNSFRSDDAETNAVGILHREMREPEFADHALRRRPSGSRRRRACGRSRRLSRRPSRQPSSPIRTSRSSVAKSQACRLRTGTASSLRPGPLTSARARRGGSDCHRRGLARLLRRHRAHRPSAFHRHGRRVDAVPLRQGGSGRRRRGLCELSDEPRASTKPLSMRCSPPRRQNSASSRARLISTAACPSKLWPSGGARRFGTAQ